MKKAFSILLCAVLLLSGCANKKADNTSPSSVTDIVTQNITDTSVSSDTAEDTADTEKAPEDTSPVTDTEKVTDTEPEDTNVPESMDVPEDTNVPDDTKNPDDTQAPPVEQSGVLYVKAGGSGDGSSADSPLGEIEAAVARAAGLGAPTKIVLLGDVNMDITQGYTEPVHSELITITGTHGTMTGGRLRFLTSDQIHWIMSGPLKFENVELAPADASPTQNIVFRCHFNPFTFGAGVVSPKGTYIIGGVADTKPNGAVESVRDRHNYNAQTNSYTGNADITLQSGTVNEIGLFTRGGVVSGATHTGKLDLRIEGSVTVNKIAVFRNRGDGTSGDANIYLNGGTVTTFVCHNHSTTNTGVRGDAKFAVIITDRFDISRSFNTAAGSGFFSGIAGSSLSLSAASSMLYDAYYGEYLCKIEAGVYDAVLSSGKIFSESFDRIEKIASGTGLSYDASKDESGTSAPPVSELASLCPKHASLGAHTCVLASSKAGTWTVGSFAGQGTRMNYKIYLPANYDAQKKYPFVIYMHGASGESINVADIGVHSPLTNTLSKLGGDAILLIPQCPDGQFWPFAEYTRELAFDLIDHIAQHTAADKDRIYLTGHSYGSIGSLYILEAHPGYFAAAILTGGAGNYNDYGAIASTPIRMYCGGNDGFLSSMQSCYETLKLCRADVALTVFEGKGHDIFNYTGNNTNAVDWMLSERRG